MGGLTRALVPVILKALLLLAIGYLLDHPSRLQSLAGSQQMSQLVAATAKASQRG